MSDRDAPEASDSWLTPDIYRRLHDLVDQASQHAPNERVAFLSAATNGEGRLLDEALVLLSARDALEGEFTDLSPGSRVGPYQVVRELGRGGMGTVYLASRADDAFDKQVAIKLIRSDADSDEVLRRFTLERQILASLEHPNIARLLDGGGLGDGRPYIVMEFVDGVPITDFADRARLTVPERIRLLQAVFAGVEHAHRHLVVHRDLKPGNILVTADGTPKLLDFGIARVLTATGMSGRITASRISPGTPRYASPEQLAGEAVGTSADVYALGVITYEMLTGGSPFRQALNDAPTLPPSVVVSASGDATLRPRLLSAIAADRGADPDRLRRQLEGDLDAIVLKALNANPADRYGSAAEFNDDFQRHLDHLPVLAQSPTTAYVALKFGRRHRGLVAAAVAVVLTVALGVTGTYSQWQRAEQERNRAERRFSSVRSLAASVLDVSASLSGGQDPLVARDALVGTSLQYLGQLEREADGDSLLLREVAAAYRRVGDVQRATSRNKVEAAGAALVTYERALRVSESLAKGEFIERDTRRDLALSLDRVGTALAETGNTQRSADTLGRSLILYKELLEADRTSARAQRDLVQAHMRFADAVAGADPAAARRSYEEAGAIAKGLAVRDPQSAEARLDLATIESRLRDIEMVANPERARMEEERFYTAISGSTDPERLEYFLQQFPNGSHNLVVRQRLADLRSGRTGSRERSRIIAPREPMSPATFQAVSTPRVAISLDWRNVPAGRFDMGCDLRPDRVCNADERPRRSVTISRAFRLAATETTIGQYRAYTQAVGATVPTQPVWNVGDLQPIVNTTWDQAAQFCAAIGGRLPTEAEWEWAALGGRGGGVYPWGDTYDRMRANAGFPGRDGWETAAPVGSFMVNGYGLADMAGNVWEWVADWYGEQYYRLGPDVDPPGPGSGPSRVLRGGAYNTAPGFLRITQRGRDTMDRRREATGFRCAQ